MTKYHHLNMNKLFPTGKEMHHQTSPQSRLW